MRLTGELKVRPLGVELGQAHGQTRRSDSRLARRDARSVLSDSMSDLSEIRGQLFRTLGGHLSDSRSFLRLEVDSIRPAQLDSRSVV